MFPRLGGNLPRRDAILFFIVGGATVYIWAWFKARYPFIQSVQIDLSHLGDQPREKDILELTQTITQTTTVTATPTMTAITTPISHAILPIQDLPMTEVLAHAPGWTLYKNLYMSNGTLFILADEKGRRRIPEIRMMVSTAMEATVAPENIAAREPTPFVMRVISPQEAKIRWTSLTGDAQYLNRVWTVEGNTLLSWEPKQFLRHYYHFVGEFIFGAQAFWHGAFSNPVPPSDYAGSAHFSIDHKAVPPFHRLIFAYTNAEGWRDIPGFNRYFLRAVMPSLTVEHEEDWNDRVAATRPTPGDTKERAFHFPLVLLADRSAAFRGSLCGSLTQRTAAEAWDYMRLKNKLMGIHVGGWWAPIREAMWRFAGAEEGLRDLHRPTRLQQEFPYLKPDIPQVRGVDTPASEGELPPVDVDTRFQLVLQPPEKIVISYISRQHTIRRKLRQEDHDGMVKALTELVEKKNKERQAIMDTVDNDPRDGLRRESEEGTVPPEWEFNELYAEQMTKDDQIKVASRTTFLLGVHGNGLSHLVFMNPNRYSTVMEIFVPGGFAHDYQWTTRALGMNHITVWNDTYHTYETKPPMKYAEGFQGNSIPVHGPLIAQIIEDRVAGFL